MLVIKFRRRTAVIVRQDNDGSETSLGEHPFEQDAEALIAGAVDEVRAGRSAVLFDLGEVDWYGSTAVGHLIKLWRQVDDAQGKATFVNVSDRISGVFRATFVDRIFHISESYEAGVAYLSD